MVHARRHHYTYREYVDLEAASNTKHEFLDGEIYAMAGGTPAHAALGIAVAAQLYDQTRGGRCRVYSSDLRVRILETGLATYPDVTVVCGEVVADPESAVTATNPTLVVEVTSPSTEAFDRGEKREHYQRIATLRAYVVVAHDRRHIDVWTRSEGWQHTSFSEGKVPLDAIGIALDVGRVYEGIVDRN
jgi:Uma2 family endonuclease